MPTLTLAGGERLSYHLVRRRRQRTLRLRLDADGGLNVSAPWHVASSLIEAFLHSRVGWIRRHRRRIIEERSRIPRLRPGARIPFLGGQVTLPELPVAWLRDQARRHFGRRLEVLAPAMGVAYQRLTVRGQTSRWGSCSTRGNLSLNWKLLLTPPQVLDYVLIHELAHLREPNHSPRFWALVAGHCPEHARHRRWLREHAYLLRVAE